MRYFVRAIVTGFGLSIGKMLYDKVSEKLGEKKAEKDADPDLDPIVVDEDSDDPIVADPE